MEHLLHGEGVLLLATLAISSYIRRLILMVSHIIDGATELALGSQHLLARSWRFCLLVALSRCPFDPPADSLEIGLTGYE